MAVLDWPGDALSPSVRARLSDARFFWIVDRKQTLESRRERLADVMFHRRLGSLLAKTDRLAAESGIE